MDTSFRKKRAEKADRDRHSQIYTIRYGTRSRLNADMFFNLTLHHTFFIGKSGLKVHIHADKKFRMVVEPNPSIEGIHLLPI
jgi:hypothetical protein